MKLRNARYVLIVSGLSIFHGSACKPQAPVVVLTKPDGSQVERPPEPAANDEKTAEDLATQADALEKRGDKLGAQKKRDELLAKYPNARAAGPVFVMRARAALAAGKPNDAIGFYEKLLFYQPTAPVADEAREKYALLLAENGRLDDAIKNLDVLYQNSKTDRFRLGILLAQTLETAGRQREALSIYVDLIDLAPESERQGLQDKALNAVAGTLSFGDAEKLWNDSSGKASWAFLQPALGFRLAKIFYHTREYDRSEQMLNLVTSRFPTSPWAASARDFLSLLKARFQLDTNAIGVVLPLSGKYKQYGERSLQAIQIAFAKSSFKLIVKDSQGEPNNAAQAVESLVLENHVVAIIGPLFSNESMAAALRAEELSVPLVSLSFREGLPNIGPFVFRTALTVSAQARGLAKVAFEELGFRRFAVLYPRSRYGIDFVNAFWDEVDKRHGEIRGAETYEPDQTTFREPVRRLVGRWYMNSRADYKAALDEIKRAKYTPMRERSEREKLDKSLPPLVDFEALVIPDGGSQIGLIAPALAFEDVVLTHDPKALDKIRKVTGHDAHPVTLMGASTWNNNQTLEHCEAYCEDSVFVDAYFPNSPDPKVRDFVAAFRELGGAEPMLSEAQAFDTASVIKEVLSTAHPASRQAVRDALTSMPPYVGVTGQFAFDQEGEAQKNLFVLTIKEHGIRLYERPPEQPRG